jgi:hypothetical protein
MPVDMEYVLVFVSEDLGVNAIQVSANPGVATSISEPNRYGIAQGIFDSINSLSLRTRSLAF